MYCAQGPCPSLVPKTEHTQGQQALPCQVDTWELLPVALGQHSPGQASSRGGGDSGNLSAEQGGVQRCGRGLSVMARYYPFRGELGNSSSTSGSSLEVSAGHMGVGAQTHLCPGSNELTIEAGVRGPGPPYAQGCPESGQAAVGPSGV